MTALAGLWSRRGEATQSAVGRMLDAQAAFGPDPAISRTLDAATLGRRLYPLVPEDDFDRGPLMGGDGTLLLAADARIDNRDEIAAALGLSVDLTRLAEPQLLMAVIERWGVAGLGRVVGAFAVMFWDARRCVLTLARDPMGERPLFFHRGDGFVAVSSMPRGLHAHPDIPYAPSETATADFLAILPEGDESFFAGIARVRPGRAVAITADGMTETSLWTPERTVLRLKPDQYAEGLRAELDRAVAVRLRRIRGTIGTHLSAGLDSASVAATAARLLGSEPLHAFTAVPGAGAPTPGGTIGDEGPAAARVAARYANIVHVPVQGDGRSPLPLLDRHFDLYQRPVMNPWNAIWGEAINDAARTCGVSVLLTGQLGNFTLSHDGVPHLAQLLAGGRLGALATLTRQLRARGWRRRRIGAATLGPFVPPAVWTWLVDRFGHSLTLDSYSALRRDAVTDLDMRAAASGTDLSYRPWRDGRAMRLWGLDRVDMGAYTKGTLAGWGIDLRDPTADRRLIEWALSVPDEQYILEGEPRSLARRAFADRLPPDLVGDQRRGYQAADWHIGATAALGELAAELDGIERCRPAEALVDVERLRGLIRDWPDFPADDPRWNQLATTDRYRSMLLRGTAAGHFLRRAARSN
jgi:asparagine synthase (glutamine-hydrolysing)